MTSDAQVTTESSSAHAGIADASGFDAEMEGAACSQGCSPAHRRMRRLMWSIVGILLIVIIALLAYVQLTAPR